MQSGLPAAAPIQTTSWLPHSDVYLMMRHQTVQNAVRARAAVKQVAHNVQTVHSQPLDDLAEADNIGVGAVIADDALNDLTVILVLVVVLKVGVKQLVEDVAAVLRQTVAHMVAGMLAGHEPAQVDEPQQRLTVPLFQRFLVGAALLELGQLLVRIVDQSRQLGPRPLRHGIPRAQCPPFRG